MGKIKFDINNLEEIIKRGYSMDQVVLLTWVQEKADLDILSRHTKVQALYQSLVRKGLITDDNHICTLGTELLEYMEIKDPTKFVRKRAPVEKKITDSVDFDVWWKAYPGTDTFVHKGISFDGSRSLRCDKDNCKVKFEKIISEGEHTPADMIGALNYDVLQKKENSVKLKTNKLTYMQNSLTYLNQRSFEPFIELMRTGAKVYEAPQGPRGGTDI